MSPRHPAPIPPAGTTAQKASVYCCYGCRIAHDITRETGDAGAVRWTILRLGLSVFFTMNLMAFTMTMWSLDVYDVEPDPFQLKLIDVFRWLSMLLALPVLLLLGCPLLQNACGSRESRICSTDLLIATGVAAAYTISAANVVQGRGAVYFEVGAMVLVAVTLGRWFEATGKQKATEALDRLAALLPETARRLNGDSERDVRSDSIATGDLLRIRGGQRFPADAVVVTGRTTVDEQIFTGESTPIERTVGDPLLAGTINLDGDVIVRATAGFRCGSFGRLLQLLQDARMKRGRYQRLADRVSAGFFPAISGIALLTFFWYLPQSGGEAVQNFLSVLLIACPCALGLATPLAIWTALSVAIRRQVLFRSADAIERLAAADAICLDKTGTLTTGSPRVTQTVRMTAAPEVPDVRGLLSELTAGSRHPYSRAIFDQMTFEQDRSINDPTTEVCSVPCRCRDIRTVSGRGIAAELQDGRIVRLGSPEFVMGEESHSGRTPAVMSAMKIDEMSLLTRDAMVQFAALCHEADRQGAAVVALSIDAVPQVVCLLTETLRAGTLPALREFQRLGLPMTILTGDRAARADHLKRELQLLLPTGSQFHVRSGLTPSDKVAAIGEAQHQSGRVIMVGDGINDAPALACSDIGVALGCGADVSRDSAQVCLLGNDLQRLAWAIRLARRTRRVIRQNLFWAFGYNAAGVCVAATGLLNSAVAAGLMIFSSLLVITNSLRLMAGEVDPEPKSTADIGNQHSAAVPECPGSSPPNRVLHAVSVTFGGDSHP